MAAPRGSSSREQAHEMSLQLVRETMQAVAMSCGFTLAEALCPREDGHCLVQSGASWHRDLSGDLFHRYSMDLLFPPNV
eukprot:CAMPEP_0202849384 /NCGR_PEP_ID=MMETSP1389-20130828/80533_1 /ASSEMBLY_ACC=CAM_ASM_000865 /TAXON_ID=302021 /ORGANISM="Rhodomonas sp., Strain CCMP768" /LENGTH=78 /DNA_ID=CAMNT_0049527387 /DNA_START=55 /DNA_END=287 /DNA_ORIENTATION=+